MLYTNNITVYRYVWEWKHMNPLAKKLALTSLLLINIKSYFLKPTTLPINLYDFSISNFNVRQKTVGQSSTMDNPGTLPIYAYNNTREVHYER